MNETGRCLNCGSEDIETYENGSSECMECGMTWVRRSCRQQHAEPTSRPYHNTRHKRVRYQSAKSTADYNRVMQPYREKWRKIMNEPPQPQTLTDNEVLIMLIIVLIGAILFALFIAYIFC